MTFKNKKHAERFFSALSSIEMSDASRELVASLYILTTCKRVWKHFKNFMADGFGICPEAFDGFEPKSHAEDALVQAAFDMLYCSDCLTLAELTDTECIPDVAFLAIIHAIGYVRYGLDEDSGRAEVTELN